MQLHQAVFAEVTQILDMASLRHDLKLPTRREQSRHLFWGHARNITARQVTVETSNVTRSGGVSVAA